MYGVKADDWEDFGKVTRWGIPKDREKGTADQTMMNAKIVEAYLKAHHDAIRKHDPNHLILGDKIQNQRPQPDWIWGIVRKYVDAMPAMLMDRVQLRQVFENLIINAMEAVKDEGRITVEARLIQAPGAPTVPYRQAESRSERLHLEYHASHHPSSGPYSPCMHRPDAETVSFSQIEVTPRRVRFHYVPHSPCLGLPRAGVVTLD